MEIIMLTVGQVCTNCYIIHQEGTNSCVVIDPVSYTHLRAHET